MTSTSAIHGGRQELQCKCPDIETTNLTNIDNEERQSKSQLKREMLTLQELGDQLVDTPDRILDSVPVSDSLREAVLEARKLKRGARRRQRQHIGSLMREEDVDGIRRSLQEAFQPHKEAVRSFHQVEVWRDALIAGDDDLMSELLERFPLADRQHLRQLARNAAKERAKNQAPKSARALFQYLTELEAGT